MSKMSLIAVASALAACGGGGGAPEPAPTNVPSEQSVPVTLPAAPAPAPAPVSGGTGVVAAFDPAPPAAEPELRQPRPPWPTGPDAARSLRSLNWWSEDPRLINYLNATCEPQPDCVVPDGDLNLHNAACDTGTVTNCVPRLKLYDDPIFAEDRIDPRPPPDTRPVCTTTFRCPPGSIDPATSGSV